MEPGTYRVKVGAIPRKVAGKLATVHSGEEFPNLDGGAPLVIAYILGLDDSYWVAISDLLPLS